jgi:hypothetical protein
VIFGAGEWTRTIDLLITNQLLYQLSYAGQACHAEALTTRESEGEQVGTSKFSTVDLVLFGTA